MCRPCAGVPGGWRAPFIQCEARGGKSSHWIAAEKCELGFSCCVLIQCETLPSHWMGPDAQNYTGSVSSQREVAHYLQKRASGLVIQTLPIRFSTKGVFAICCRAKRRSTGSLRWAASASLLKCSILPSSGRRIGALRKALESPLNLSFQRKALLRGIKAFQFPSWYNGAGVLLVLLAVLPAFQFPSWYNQDAH